jgi:predicted amidohydrolase
MSTIKIAVASTPLTTTLVDAVPAAIAAIEDAGRQGARIVCLPETGVPGHRVQADDVPDVSDADLHGALDTIADATRRAGVVAIVGTERHVAGGREIVSVVIGADGRRLGEQAKTQIDPTEETASPSGSPSATRPSDIPRSSGPWPSRAPRSSSSRTS